MPELDRLPELPPADPGPVPHLDVDPGAQALVWGIVASQHGSDYLTLLQRQRDRRTSGEVPSTEEYSAEQRDLDYHQDAHRIADKLAGMWALVTSAQPFEEVAITDKPTGETHTSSELD